MPIQIKTKQVERRRFIKTQPLSDPLEWLTELSSLKDFLAKETNYQLVGAKVYFEMTMNQKLHPKMMLEVVGTPIPLEDHFLEMVDHEKTRLFIYQLIEKDIFNSDFSELIAIGARMQAVLAKSQPVDDLFHIVYDNAKIELHFFLQKDYIQKQF